ncbi:Uncharacterized protein dnm_077820 [Desulfonema magnum]|uniref:Uncharacterized protein n=1 Tax=Desulfonema magnum TaxID=45655 RepID=A0A975GT36_9BACT|nr:Uncharacterized protein dnm_077820 [Desulfonema magnum]
MDSCFRRNDRISGRIVSKKLDYRVSADGKIFRLSQRGHGRWGRNPAFPAGEVPRPEKSRVSLLSSAQSENFSIC